LVRNTRIPSHVATRDYPHRYPKKIKSEANGRKRLVVHSKMACKAFPSHLSVF
jgi:hypothetical protein